MSDHVALPATVHSDITERTEVREQLSGLIENKERVHKHLVKIRNFKGFVRLSESFTGEEFFEHDKRFPVLNDLI